MVVGVGWACCVSPSLGPVQGQNRPLLCGGGGSAWHPEARSLGGVLTDQRAAAGTGMCSSERPTACGESQVEAVRHLGSLCILALARGGPRLARTALWATLWVLRPQWK